MLKEEKYLTIQEVADRLRTDYETVRRWINEGRIHSIRPGRKILIAESALESFERSCGNGGTSTL